MEDLRVLEQQQRESQRKLASSRLTKEHKETQKTNLETKIASLKYANGQQRAQLARSRELLHTSACQVGTAKLRSDTSGTNLKDFDNQLKVALSSTRSMQVLRRKIDGRLILMRNNDTIMTQLLEQNLEQVKAMEKEHNSVNNYELSLRRIIQENHDKTKLYMDEATTVLMDISGLEEDFASAKLMEASTKLRAESIATAIEFENKRHTVSMQTMISKLELSRQKEATKLCQEKSFQDEIRLKTKTIHDAWTRLIVIQKQEGYVLSSEPVYGTPISSFDSEIMRKNVEAIDKELQTLHAAKEKIVEDSDQQTRAIAELREEALNTKDDAERICQVAKNGRNVELARKEKMNRFRVEIEMERKIVSDLRRGFADLQVTRDDEKRSLEVKLSERTESIMNVEAERENSRKCIAEEESTIDNLKAFWETEKLGNTAKIIDAKGAADQARSTYDVLCQEAFAIITGYPKLTQLKIDYDPRKSLDDQVEEILGDLKTECENRIAVVTNERERREQELVAKEANKRRKFMENKRLERLERIEREAKEMNLAALKAAEKVTRDQERKRTEKLIREKQRKARKEAEQQVIAERERLRVNELKAKENKREVKKKELSSHKKGEEGKALKKAEQARDLLRHQERAAECETNENLNLIQGQVLEQEENQKKEFSRKARKVVDREIDTGIIEVPPHDMHCFHGNVKIGSASDFDLGCLTQREGLHVPTLLNSNENDLDSHSQMRVRWEGLDDCAGLHDMGSTRKLVTVGAKLFSDPSLTHNNDELQDTYEVPSRCQVVNATGSSRESRLTSSSKDRSTVNSFDDTKGTTPSFSGHHRAGDGRNYTRRRKLPASSALSKTTVDSLRQDDFGHSKESASNRILVHQATSFLHSSSSRHASDSRPIDSEPIDKPSKEIGDILVIQSKPLHRTSSGTSTQNEKKRMGRRILDVKKCTKASNEGLKYGPPTLRSLSPKLLSKKRVFEPDAAQACIQTSGISSGERASLANKSRRRKKPSSSNSAADVVAKSGVLSSKVKSQKTLSSVVGLGGIGDYDFAF